MKSGVIDANINNRIQELEERISGAKGTIKGTESTVKENEIWKKSNQNIQGTPGQIEKTNPKVYRYRIEWKFTT